VATFKEAFGKTGTAITMDEVSKAIASFERTLVSGNSPFDRWYFRGEKTALSPKEKRGFQVFLREGRCVSCHTVGQTYALFTDNKFHNIGVGFPKIAGDVPEMAAAYLEARGKGASVDVTVLTNQNVSELGRFAVTNDLTDVGGFKTSTLRNIAKTGPYMHDGSLETLEDVVDFYDNGGKEEEDDPDVPYLSGGIRPLDLTDEQKEELVAFLKALTSPEYNEVVAAR
jgi:cytochrome c peroxidase